MRSDPVVEPTINPFLGPEVSLPRTGEVELLLQRVSGRNDCDPQISEEGSPIGFDVENLDTQRFRLHPDVLLMPVHVHVFADSDGKIPHNYWQPAPFRREYAQQWFDGREVGMDDMWRINGKESSDVGVTAGKVWTDWPMPDAIWTQCNIQFRLESYEVIHQSKGLEEKIFTEEEYCASFGGACRDDTRIFEYWNDPVRSASSNPGIHVYMGGTIESDACAGGFFPTVLGVACHAGCAASDDNDVFVALNMPEISDNRVISSRAIAHELGHYLGLGHQDASCVEDWPDDDPSLMTAGLGDATRLTAGQCAHARCVAGDYLSEWGLREPTCP